MPAYVRKTNIEDEFGAKRAPGGVIACGNCSCDLADLSTNPDGKIYMLYTDKSHVKSNIPYEVYCEACIASGFPRAIII